MARCAVLQLVAPEMVREKAWEELENTLYYIVQSKFNSNWKTKKRLAIWIDYLLPMADNWRAGEIVHAIIVVVIVNRQLGEIETKQQSLVFRLAGTF